MNNYKSPYCEEVTMNDAHDAQPHLLPPPVPFPDGTVLPYFTATLVLNRTKPLPEHVTPLQKDKERKLEEPTVDAATRPSKRNRWGADNIPAATMAFADMKPVKYVTSAVPVLTHLLGRRRGERRLLY
jgi:hypothetical protein